MKAGINEGRERKQFLVQNPLCIKEQGTVADNVQPCMYKMGESDMWKRSKLKKTQRGQRGMQFYSTRPKQLAIVDKMEKVNRNSKAMNKTKGAKSIQQKHIVPNCNRAEWKEP